MKMLSDIDLHSLWKDLDAFEHDVDQESKRLDDISNNIIQLRGALEDEADKLRNLPEFDFLPPNESIKFNVGGQLFEAPVAILIKDPASVLAICCRRLCTLEKLSDGSFYFDRDWWLFRLILSFLRSKILPSDTEVLKELYKEASYYRLVDLKSAIDSIPINKLSTHKL